MKKFLLTLAVLGALSAQVFAQSVDFRNNNMAYSGTTLIDSTKLVRDVAGNALTGSNWKAVLYAGVSAQTLSLVSGSISSFRDEPTSFDGTWSGGTKTLTGFSEGQSIVLKVAVYDGNQFASFENAVAGNGVVGSSATFNYTIPTAGSAASAFFMTNFSGFQLAAVPEPTTIALGVMGGMALLARRRRNAA